MAGSSLAGISLRSNLPGSVLGEDSPLCGIDDTAISPPTTLAAGMPMPRPGWDLMTWTWSSARTPTPDVSCWPGRSSGCAEPGDQARIIEDESALVGGKRPINPSGGLLSKGEPLGASALGQVVEIVRQLRGTAGARQVEGARVGLAHVIGRGANACVTLLVR